MAAYIIILIFAVSGVLVCLQIDRAKRTGQSLVCAVGTDCNKVIHSRYNNILGIQLEVIGVLYYSLLAIFSFLLLAGFLKIFNLDIKFILSAVSALGAFFSLIFLYIQTVIIKEWCEYCLFSSGLSLIIFVVNFLI